MRDLQLVRTLRTPSSERFILRRDSADFASLDLHYLPRGSVHGTLVILEEAGLGEAEIHALLQVIDERLLPEVALDQHDRAFSVIVGKSLGAFRAEGSSGG